MIKLVNDDLNNIHFSNKIHTIITDPPYLSHQINEAYSSLYNFAKRHDTDIIFTIVNHTKVYECLKPFEDYDIKIPVIFLNNYANLLNFYKTINKFKIMYIITKKDKYHEYVKGFYPTVSKVSAKSYKKKTKRLYEWEQYADIPNFVLKSFDLASKTVCDCYAGVGGYVLPLLNKVNHLIGIEKDFNRFNILRNRVNIMYGVHNKCI